MTDTNPPELYWSESERMLFKVYEAEHVSSCTQNRDALPADAERLVPASEPPQGQQYRITVDVPDCLPRELLDGLFTAVADAVAEWEPKDREGWDSFVSGGPADHTAEAYAARLEDENTALHEQLHRANELLAEEMRSGNARIEAVAAEARAELGRLREHTTQLPADWREQLFEAIRNGQVIATVESWRPATHPTPQRIDVDALLAEIPDDDPGVDRWGGASLIPAESGDDDE
ncbi:hypothetical protein ABZ215_24930 [Amycolatopsis sp. NPDC006131]|uniref:hypothetical protein n=1 Tax=Amycolatopsis sp. NPDC006131 TaxID=3156731 RepID=UPI0033A325B7